jgi:hypothetical protein
MIDLIPRADCPRGAANIPFSQIPFFPEVLMRPKTMVILALLVFVVVAGWAGFARTARAQLDSADLRPGPLPSYTEAIDNFMDLLSKGKIDDALATIDFYKDQPEAKQIMRDRLIRLGTEQHRYFGYDIVSAQRFSPRLQSVSIIACYDVQPIVFHFDFYHPEAGGNQPWIIPGFSMSENVIEELKDVPVDYHPAAR